MSTGHDREPEPLVLERLAAFVATVRAAGVAVPSDALASFAQAVAVIGGERQGLYWSGRATLVSRREDLEPYDLAFESFFASGSSAEAAVPASATVVDLRAASNAVEREGETERCDETDGDDIDIDLPVVRASRREVLRHRDFAAYEPHELVEARALMAELRTTSATRPSRRRKTDRRARGPLDVRSTVAAARRTGGEIVRLHHTRSTRAPRRVVFLLDVSGSMAAYSRALLQFSQVAVSARREVEVFTMGTRLTRLTRQLRGHDPDQAVARAAASVPDWAGGTRLGRSLQRFNDQWGIRGVARGAIVVLLSDGWERDDPAQLASELERLRRVAHRIVWVNPLKASAGYEPVARGMAAALPHVDVFVAGHTLDALGDVARAIGWAERQRAIA